MPLEAGHVVFGGDIQESRPKGTNVEAGDAVALSGGESVEADTEANEFAGVAGETETVLLNGGVVANVAAGVAEGSRLGAGNATGGTTGALIAESGGPAVALSDEGGTWHGSNQTYDVPDGYAVVYF
jgi:hypothetical protein